mmetsp:Transcript_4546/g.10175  ORF Transcript_4546/g.10175 Transcript_4546/m.10175 type:complete len:221 (+) Transcript_4546:2951-3613(+)
MLASSDLFPALLDLLFGFSPMALLRFNSESLFPPMFCVLAGFSFDSFWTVVGLLDSSLSWPIAHLSYSVCIPFCPSSSFASSTAARANSPACSKTRLLTPSITSISSFWVMLVSNCPSSSFMLFPGIPTFVVDAADAAAEAVVPPVSSDGEFVVVFSTVSDSAFSLSPSVILSSLWVILSSPDFSSSTFDPDTSSFAVLVLPVTFVGIFFSCDLLLLLVI